MRFDWIPRFTLTSAITLAARGSVTLYGPPEVTGDQMVAAMDAVGVDGAILASPSACIATTGQLHPNVFAAHPSRFSWSSRPIRPTPPSTVFWPQLPA